MDMLQCIPLSLEGLLLVRNRSFHDERGHFVEVYRRDRYREIGIPDDFVQDNQSLSRFPGVVRGLHFQRPPFAQAKLVRVLSGRILDVVVDLRRGSPTYGRYEAAELTADTHEQLYVPIGFAHGFCTLEPDTVVTYKVSAHYAPDHDAGIHWADPDIGITWPVPSSAAIVSPKDRVLPRLRDIESPFLHVRP
jgi:dTDP-4-dehydrorhamnose 3,5-epimerase